jgi:hypothetical protein
LREGSGKWIRLEKGKGKTVCYRAPNKKDLQSRDTVRGKSSTAACCCDEMENMKRGEEMEKSFAGCSGMG